MSLNRRVKTLEDNVLEGPKPGTTRFCHWDLPQNEQLLLEKARNIAMMEIPYEETTEQQRVVIDEAGKILNFRIFDLFTGYLDSLLSRDDRIAKVIVHERFLWFFRELAEEVRQNLEASEIEKNAPEDSDVDAVDQYFRSQRDVFTPESYDKISTEMLLDVMRADPDWEKKVREGLKLKVETP